jgi:hypothetical protein
MAARKRMANRRCSFAKNGADMQQSQNTSWCAAQQCAVRALPQPNACMLSSPLPLFDSHEYYLLDTDLVHHATQGLAREGGSQTM